METTSTAAMIRRRMYTDLNVDRRRASTRATLRVDARDRSGAGLGAWLPPCGPGTVRGRRGVPTDRYVLGDVIGAGGAAKVYARPIGVSIVK